MARCGQVQVLGGGDLAAEAVARRVGLRDRTALSRLLKARTGMGLRAFRRRLFAQR